MLFNSDGTWNRENSGKYKAILELDKMLTEKNIPHELAEIMDGWQICYPHDGEGRIGDVIEHFGSYGNKEDLLEVYGFGLNEPDGWLTAAEAFEYFRKAHEKAEEVAV